MSETLRNLTDTLALLPVNTSKAIGAQDVRDSVASMFANAGSIGSSTTYQNVATHGADPTGVADSSAAIQAAIDAAGASGEPSVVMFPPGNYRLDTGILCDYDWQTWIIYGVRFLPTGTFTGAAVTIGATTKDTTHFQSIGFMRVEPTTSPSTWFWDTLAVGVDLINLQYSAMDKIFVKRMYKGVVARGVGDGFIDNTINIGHLQTNVWGLQVTATANGWANANTFIGGRIALQTGALNPAPGVLHSAALGYPLYLGHREPALTVSGASNASPIVVTVTIGHGLETGDVVTITGVVGNTAANVAGGVITKTGQKTFSLNGTTGNGAYVNGGTVAPADSCSTAMGSNQFVGMNLEGNSGILPSTARWPYGIFLNATRINWSGRFELTSTTPDDDNFGKNVYADTIRAGQGSLFTAMGSEASAADNIEASSANHRFNFISRRQALFGGGEAGVPTMVVMRASGDDTEAAIQVTKKDLTNTTRLNADGSTIVALPTADPSVAGELWIDTGAGRVVKVSAG